MIDLMSVIRQYLHALDVNDTARFDADHAIRLDAAIKLADARRVLRSVASPALTVVEMEQARDNVVSARSANDDVLEGRRLVREALRAGRDSVVWLEASDCVRALCLKYRVRLDGSGEG